MAPSYTRTAGMPPSRRSIGRARRREPSSGTGTRQRGIPSIAGALEPRSGRIPASVRAAAPCFWLARGLAPLTVAVPAAWETCRVLEARLVFDKQSSKYTWHMVLEDGLVPPVAPGDRVLAVDMGEIHPSVIADTEQALVLSCRALRACKQYGNKRRSELASLRDRKKRGSNNRKRIQKRMNRFKAQQERRERDILHKVGARRGRLCG